MPARPTLHQIAYMPDLGECLTGEQARCLLDRSRPGAEELAGRVVAELAQRHLQPSHPSQPLTFRSEADLVETHHRNPHVEWICVGTVPFQSLNVGPAMHIALQWWWDDGLRVGWWLLRPTPTWDR